MTQHDDAPESRIEPGPKPEAAAAETELDLLGALADETRLDATVPRALDLVEGDPMVSAGHFRGDVLRGLMEVRGEFWAAHARLYQRYQAAVRRAAWERRLLPLEVSREFWTGRLPRALAAARP